MDSNLPPPPPPLNSTPPIIVNTPPPPKSSSGWRTFAIILLVLLIGIVAFNVLGVLGSLIGGGGGVTGAQSGKHFHEVVVDNPTAKEKIAVLEVKGMISSDPWSRGSKSLTDIIEDQLKWAGEDDNVKAVILKVDSPGGEVMASDDIANAIRKFQDKHKKPVVASMGSLAASGGYYVSAPCQWIVANDLTITGSIGVIMHGINYRGLMDKVGVQPMVFKSGRFKDMLSGSKRPEEQDPAEKEMIQNMIMETYGKFKKVIADGRAAAVAKNKGKGKTLATNWTELADGRVLTGRQAFDNGFVDEIGNFETALDTTKKLAGISGDARLIRYQEPFSLADMFTLFGKSDANRITIDVGLAESPKLQMGKMYFLYHPAF